MRYLVAGLGSIGRRHLTNLRNMDPAGHITVYRTHSRTRDETLCEANAYVYSLDAALEARPDIAVISGPASTHVSMAMAFAEAGVHILVEKPLSNTLEGVDALISLVKKKSLTAMVGYNLRFDPGIAYLRSAVQRGEIGRLVALQAHVGMYLPDWRPAADYRKTVSAQAGLGGGAVLELSHELDYSIWLAGDIASVCATTSRLGNFEMDVEDTADILAGFRDGVAGNLHLNMIERAPSRWCQLTGLEGTLTWNGVDQTVRLYNAKAGLWSDSMSFAHDRNSTYMAELSHFIECVDTGAAPLISLLEARRVLEFALAAKRSAQEHRTITL